MKNKIASMLFLLIIVAAIGVNAAPTLPIANLTDIEKALDSGVPLILMATTESCTICTEMKEYFPILAQEFKGKINFMMTDTNKYLDVRVMLRVRIAPTTFFYDKYGNMLGSTDKPIDEKTIRDKMKEYKMI